MASSDTLRYYHQDAASRSTRITVNRVPHPIYHPYTTLRPSSTQLYYSNKSRGRSLWRCNGSENHGKYLLAPRLVYAFCIYFSRFALNPSYIAKMEYILIKSGVRAYSSFLLSLLILFMLQQSVLISWQQIE